MTTCIFIRTYLNDFQWLKYCLRSISKFISEIDQIVICVPNSDMGEILKFGLTRERIVFVDHNSYMWQQIDKTMADTATSCENILYIDSDCVAVREFSPRDMMFSEKPIVFITPYASFSPGEVPWQSITAKALGFEPEFETMRRFPFLYPRWLLSEFRAYIKSIHGRSITEYVCDQPDKHYSEFNAIGSYAHRFHHEKFHWINTLTTPMPSLLVRQFWSYSGVTKEVAKEMETLLA